jgi:hypothetical protein
LSVAGESEDAVQDFHTLKVWQKAHQLTLDIYRATVALPKEELYGPISQIRRASSSIPANIAEGYRSQENAGCAHRQRQIGALNTAC